MKIECATEYTFQHKERTNREFRNNESFGVDTKFSENYAILGFEPSMLIELTEGASKWWVPKWYHISVFFCFSPCYRIMFYQNIGQEKITIHKMIIVLQGCELTTEEVTFHDSFVPFEIMDDYQTVLGDFFE